VVQTKLGVKPASAASLAPISTLRPQRPSRSPDRPAHAQPPPQRMVFVIAGLLIAAGTAAIVALAVTGAL
jgi:hypothetical protein